MQFIYQMYQFLFSSWFSVFRIVVVRPVRMVVYKVTSALTIIRSGSTATCDVWGRKWRGWRRKYRVCWTTNGLTTYRSENRSCTVNDGADGWEKKIEKLLNAMSMKKYPKKFQTDFFHVFSYFDVFSHLKVHRNFVLFGFLSHSYSSVKNCSQISKIVRNIDRNERNNVGIGNLSTHAN